MISNTHWDREWRFSAQRTRHMLVYMIDMLLDIFEKQPDFKYFHLDSQTLPIQDYLEIRPEMENTIRKYVEDGRLIIGPWFCLPDEFCVSGESLIRNLLLGHKIARRLGEPAKTGYSPFSWGQISQMPQIYLGFGIDISMFYRGINTIVAPRSEFMWEGADGTQILGSRLAARPRYNIWYILQRPVYWNENDINFREVSWKRGHGPFRFIDSDNYELDYQYTNPEFGYYKKHIPEHAQQAIDEQNDEWTTPHRFWSIGHDSSCPDIREIDMTQDCNDALGDQADVFFSTIKDLQDGIRDHKDSNWPLIKGEMRYSYTEGSSSALWGWILSARIYVKQDNFRTERLITDYAEPLAVFASLLGAPYPNSFIDMAYNYMLQTHGHDSIGGCGRDIVHDDVVFRLRQSREISTCVVERSLMDIVSAIDLSTWSTEDMAVVVYNPTPFKRTEVNTAVIEIPLEWESESYEIVDEAGNKLPIQIIEEKSPYYQVVQSPNNVPNTFPAKRFFVKVEYPDIPGLGYRTFKVLPIVEADQLQPKTMLTGIQTMENEFLNVRINSNGTIDVKHKETDKVYKGLGYFRDSSEIGNPWQHYVPPHESFFTTVNEKARIALVRDGELETSFQIKLNWVLPESRSHDERTRSNHYKTLEIVNTVKLRKGQPWVEIITEVNNTIEDHYLQVSFPTGLQFDDVMAQGQFDVIQRSIKKPDYSLYKEIPQTEQPMNSFIDMSEGKAGCAILNEGLKGYEAHDDPDGTVSLSLIRAFPLRICVTSEMLDYSDQDKGTQCPGKHTFKYAVYPHSGNWETGDVWKVSEQFNLMLHAVQAGPTKHGTQPLERSFLELKPENLHVSAVKQSEDGEGWIVRLFNPYTEEISGSIRLNGGYSNPHKTQSPVERVKAEFKLPEGTGKPWSKVQQVTLEEIAEKTVNMDQDGWITIDIQPKKILTFKFSS